MRVRSGRMSDRKGSTLAIVPLPLLAKSFPVGIATAQESGGDVCHPTSRLGRAREGSDQATMRLAPAWRQRPDTSVQPPADVTLAVLMNRFAVDRTEQRWRLV